MNKSVLILSGFLTVGMAGSAIADSVMPAPKVTQFKAESGTAPVASGQSDAVNNLPPVTDVNSATTKAVVTPPVTVTANVSADANNSPVIDTSGQTVHAQLRILQNQVNSLMQRNSAENMAALQVQLQKINGKLAEEQNNLVNLQKKQNSFYANLDQRIGVLEQIENYKSECENNTITDKIDTVKENIESTYFDGIIEESHVVKAMVMLEIYNELSGE